MWISGTKSLWPITYASPKIVSSTSSKPHYFSNDPTSTGIRDDKSSTHPHSHSLSLPLATPLKPSLHFVVKANSPLTLTLILIVFWLISIHLPTWYHPTTQLTQTTTATTKPRKQDPRKKIIHRQIISSPCRRQAKFDGFFVFCWWDFQIYWFYLWVCNFWDLLDFLYNLVC